MADRYLIGTGARNWNDTANWAASSGGSGGETVPTSSDNVVFDSNSGTGTVTVNAIANMLDFTVTGISAITLANAAYAFNVYGSLTLPASNLIVSFTGTGYFYFKSTSTGKTITMGSTSGRSFNRLYFDGAGGGWTNQDEMNVGNTYIILKNGTWDHGNYNVTQTNKLAVESGTKTLTLGSGTYKLYYWSIVSAANFTFNRNTSTVEFTNPIDLYLWTGTNFYNLTLSGESTSNTWKFLQDVIIHNIFTITGVNATNKRHLVASNTIGTARTITCNGTITASNVDFRDITLAGTASRDLSAITGGSGDCGGNSGITFTTPQTNYFYKNGVTANLADAANWYLGTGGSGGAGRFPLPHDTQPVFDENSFTQTCTLSVNAPRFPSVDLHLVNRAVTWNLANNFECYGHYVLGENITVSSGYTHGFFSVSDVNIETYGKLIVNGGITFQRGIKRIIGNTKSRYFYVYSGSVYLGNGIHEVTDSTSQVIYTTGTIYPEGSTIKLTAASGSGNAEFEGYGKTFNVVHFAGSHTGNFDIEGSNTFAKLIIDPGRKVRVTAGTTQKIGAASEIAGTDTSPVTIDCVTASTYTLARLDAEAVLNRGVDMYNTSLKGCTAGSWLTVYNGTDAGSNTGVTFANWQPRIMVL